MKNIMQISEECREARGEKKKKEPRQGYRMKKSMCLLIFSCFLVSDVFFFFFLIINKGSICCDCVLYHQTKVPIDFRCRRKLNFISFI